MAFASVLPMAQDLNGVTQVADVQQAVGCSDEVWQAFAHQAGDPGNNVRLLAALPAQVVLQGCFHAVLPNGDGMTAPVATTSCGRRD